MRQLVIDSASEACSVALFDEGALVDHRHAIIGRGHAEKLLPFIAELEGGGRAGAIFVGCGPGSFAGVRIGVAAARALGFGWDVPVRGFSTLALVAAAHREEVQAGNGALVVMEGGHGQWFVQPFDDQLAPRGQMRSLLPDVAIGHEDALVIGNRAEAFVEQRGHGRALSCSPDARAFPFLPDNSCFDPPTPIYGRAPDAKPMAAR
ncbi:tRNA (adenosine(37)-N6)-threonylcarbamoyltransferase complex dimerization subunit type 1 TsaB [Sphingopyxis sp. MWB1]|uniref:tRNA (adenosine(37)-N6)-threonylcarbamoyltransferase complex dimerization subunit type 1 TsaB n=1 Tax=Sphingopyxis sp. MWB1 TaxID=1537715 RepID=UPI00051A46B3|nr:tRNA (adenosine(37)-N6)-threonylcarbamoyltransferase complex dimerization subunit type 1 TsaB [Sphingopyxis sp. MWB1]